MTTVVEALTGVMHDAGAVRKDGRNKDHGYNFRGIDAVMNACSPAFIKHGVVCVPKLQSIERSTVEVGRNRTLMGHVAVIVEFVFHGPDGDSIVAVAPGEAMDSGDKATAKAMSVAFRTALLQALCLPTDEPDPDEHSYDRSPVRSPEEIEAARRADAEAWAGAIAEIDVCTTDEQLRDLWQRYASAGALTLRGEDGTTLGDRIVVRKEQLAAEALPFDQPLPAEGDPK